MLARSKNSSEPGFELVNEMRNRVGADIVFSVARNGGGIGGLAYVNSYENIMSGAAAPLGHACGFLEYSQMISWVHEIAHVMSCNHCENPACVAACPAGALQKDPDTGIVLHDAEVCIKCKTCMEICPYGAPQFDEVADLIVKCDTCLDLRNAGMTPNCVAACPMRALDFGDLDELREKYGDDLVSDLPFLPSSEETHPNVLIKPSPAAQREDFTEIVM